MAADRPDHGVAEGTESTESAESTAPSVSSENSDDNSESTGKTENAESTESAEHPAGAGSAENAESMESTENSDAGAGMSESVPATQLVPVIWLGGLAALLVGALVSTVFLAVDVSRAESEDSGRAEALHVARQLAVNFTTLDYRSYDSDMQRVRELTADEFAEQSEDIFGQLRQLVQQNQMVSKGAVKEAGLVSYDSDSARALVAANSTVSNVATEQPEERYYRFMVDLSREEAGWRVVDLQIVG